MPAFIKILTDLFEPSYDEVHERDEDYLAEAVDMHDLEHRMQALEHGRRSLFATEPNGIFAA